MIGFKSDYPEKLRMRLITWNQSRKPQKVFKEHPELLIRDAEQNDIIIITSQECEAMYKAYRV